MNSPILKTAARLLVSLIVVFSVYLTLRGHNAPGGGFAGALVASTAFPLFAIAEGPAAVRRALRIDPLGIAAAGLGLALFSGLAGWAAGRPLLTGIWWGAAGVNGGKPVIGTPIVFDIGVYLAVVGTIVALVLALEED